MENERAQIITVGSEEYELLLTTAATKEIGVKYGGLEKLGDELMNPENFKKGIDAITGVICILANQSIRRNNCKKGAEKREELTPETLELMTEPWELTEFNTAVMAAITKGTARNVRSETDPKNAQGG